jgi:hypothetical protein
VIDRVKIRNIVFDWINSKWGADTLFWVEFWTYRFGGKVKPVKA